MRFSELLFEYDRAKAMAAFGGKLQARIASDSKVASIEDLFTQLEHADPTSNKQYVNWLVRSYQAGSKLEDLTSRGHDSLEKFELLKKHKQLPADKTDISKYENLQQLEDELVKYAVKKPGEVQIDRGKYKILADTPNIRIIIPEDETAAKFWGQGTRWCTAANKNNMFDYYINYGPLYVIIPKHPKYPGEKYQFHFTRDREESDQFMNEKDEEIDNLSELINRYPELRTYFANKSPIFKENPTDADYLKFIKRNPESFKFIAKLNPSEEVQRAAILALGGMFKYIKNPSEAIKLLAVKEYGGNIKHIDAPTEQMKLSAVKDYPFALQFIDNQSEEVKWAAINAYPNGNGAALQFIKNPTPEMIDYAIKDNPMAIAFVENPTEEQQELAVLISHKTIANIKNPIEKVQLMAVKRDPYAIQYIKNPTEKVQLAAVNKDATALIYIKNPTPAVQNAAVNENPWVISNVSKLGDITPEMAKIAISKEPRLIDYVPNPSIELQKLAISLEPKTINYIQNPSPEIKQYWAEVTKQKKS